MSDKILKVLVVDDSVFSRQTIKRMLEGDPEIKVVDVASSGIDAMAKTLRLKPDLITLDFEMPEMDGFSFLRWLMQEMPLPVIMVSSYSDMKMVFKALELGAVDFVAKPSKRTSREFCSIERDLLTKVKGIKGLNMSVLNRTLQLLRRRKEPEPAPSKGMIDVVAVGSSTGGPAALQVILKELPEDFPAGVIISQHIPKGFTNALAGRLNEISRVRVKRAEDGDEVQAGKVLICPGESHMRLRKSGKRVLVVLKDSSCDDRYVPSIDGMMISTAEHYGENAMGVVLTGMGNDGREGMVEIKQRGGYTIVESKETAVVFGMPSKVIKADAAVRVLPLQDISREIIRVVKGGQGRF